MRKARVSAFGHSLIRCTVLNAGGCLLEARQSLVFFLLQPIPRLFLGPTRSSVAAVIWDSGMPERLRPASAAFQSRGLVTHWELDVRELPKMVDDEYIDA